MKTPEKKVLKDLYFIKSFLFSHDAQEAVYFGSSSRIGLNED